MRILFATPAYWPAVAFGGPTRAAKELSESLVRAGHEVDVLTTSLRAIGEPPASRFATHTETIGGVRVRYLATPGRYRWMGITPTLPLAWPWRTRPDVVHVFGYRDVVTTLTAAWARRLGIPYVFEPLDMFVPRFRNVPLKRAFDRALGKPVAHGAAVVVACSEHERRQLAEAGLKRIEVRPNGFPAPQPNTGDGALRERLGLDGTARLALYAGRVSFKKGLDLLLEAAAGIDGLHVAVVGPDDGDGTLGQLEAQRAQLGLEHRFHLVGPLDMSRPGAVYGDADVFVLPSRNENFGIVAAEAAASGTPVVVTDRCGVAEFLDGAALVVGLDPNEIRDALARLLSDTALHRQLAEAGPRVAAGLSWDRVAQRQVELYELARERR
ncbi:MAG TPA: glycosyltransferase [Gaiellaceae bacterium]